MEQEYINQLESLESLFNAIYGILFAGAAIAELGVFGIIAVITLIAAAVVFIIGIVIYIIKSYAISTFAKKLNYAHPWLAWVPIKYFRIYVLADMVGDKRLEFWHGKFKHNDRKISFWAYLGIDLVGPTIINILSSLFMMVPAVGILGSAGCYILGFIPLLACAIIEYIYFRDLLDLFKEDRHSNEVTSFVITLIDAFLGGGLIRAIYLLTMKKAEPLDKVEYEEKEEKEESTQTESETFYAPDVED